VRSDRRGAGRVGARDQRVEPPVLDDHVVVDVRDVLGVDEADQLAPQLVGKQPRVDVRDREAPARRALAQPRHQRRRRRAGRVDEPVRGPGAGDDRRDRTLREAVALAGGHHDRRAWRTGGNRHHACQTGT
jgi:hypothetical protein